MLCQAAELEHGIMCQYLFAAFSLKQHDGEGPEQRGAGRGGPALAQADHRTSRPRRCCTWPWCRTCCPRSARPRTCPGRTSRSPPATTRPGCMLALLPFGEAGAASISCSSSGPEGMALHDARRAGRLQPGASRLMRPSATSCRTLQDFATDRAPVPVDRGGHRPTWPSSTASGGCSSARRGPRPRSEHFGWPELVPVTDAGVRAAGHRRRSSSRARARAETGANAHFGQFVADPRRVRAAHARPVPRLRPGAPGARRRTSARSERDPDVPLVTDPLAAAGDGPVQRLPTRSCC